MFFIQRVVKNSSKIKYATDYFQSMNSYLLKMDKAHKEQLKQIQEKINFSILSQSNFKTLCPPSTNRSSA